MAAIAGLGWSAAGNPFRRTASDLIHLGEIRLGDVAHGSIQIRNRHPWRAAKILAAATDCSCVTVQPDVLSVPGLGSASITATVTPRADQTVVSAAVRLMQGAEPAVHTRVEAVVAPPFAGWPEFASAGAREGALVVPLDERYRGQLRTIQCYTQDGSAIPAQIDESRNEIIIQGAVRQRVRLVAEFVGTGWTMWDGPIQLSGDSRAPQ